MSSTKRGRQATCFCGVCGRCRHREYMRWSRERRKPVTPSTEGKYDELQRMIERMMPVCSLVAFETFCYRGRVAPYPRAT